MSDERKAPATTGRAFRLEEAGAYLGCAAETVRRAYKRGHLPGVKDGLKVGSPLIFMQEDLDAYRESRFT